MPTQTDGPQQITEWFERRLPADWLAGKPQVTVDEEEILVLLPVDPDTSVTAFREETRPRRMEIASEAQERFARTVSWGVRAGDSERLFTTLSVPTMTRLRQPERAVLDTLVAGGVARSRSEALAWCVKLVGRHEADWLQDLREALTHVERARSEGPVQV
jgi:hypothetical protein